MTYTGTLATIVFGQGGLMRHAHERQLPLSHLVEAEGLTFEHDVAEREGGAALVAPDPITGGPSIWTGLDWWPDLVTHRLLLYGVTVPTGLGTVYKATLSGSPAVWDLDAVALIGSLNAQFDRGQLVAGGAEDAGLPRKAFFLSRANQIKVLTADGATMASIATPATEWTSLAVGYMPAGGIVFLNRLFVWVGHRLFASSPTNHETFSVAGGVLTWNVYPGVGERIAAAAIYRERLYLFKHPQGLVRLDTDDPDPGKWRVELYSEALGVADTPHAVVATDDDVLFVTAHGGLGALSAVESLGGIAPGDLAETLRIAPFLRDQLDPTYLGGTQTLWYPAKQVASFAAVSRGYATNRLRLDLHLAPRLRDQPVRVAYSFRDVPDWLGLVRDPAGVARPVLGDNTGRLWWLDQADRTKAGAPYPVRLTHPETDFGWLDPQRPERWATREKQVDAVELVAEPTPVTVSLDVQVDGRVIPVTCRLHAGGQVVPVGAMGTRVRTTIRDTTPANFRLHQLRYYLRRAGAPRR